jgi:hypothetical protein
MPHARLSPSSSHRWLTCSGSLKHEKEDGPQNKYAEEGAHAHAILEAVLRGQMVLAGDIIDGKEATAERIQQAIEVRDYVRQWHKVHYDFVMETETPVEIGEHLAKTPAGIIMPRDVWSGTIDVAAWNAREALVLDAKFGFVRVEPKDNPQLMSYCIGLAFELHSIGFTPQHYTLIIAQPNYEGVMDFREHRITLRDLADWVVGHKERILAAYRGDATLDASDEKACRYCAGRVGCPARLEAVHNFNQQTWLEAHSLEELLPYIPRLRAICNDLEKKAAAELLEGHDIKGFKLVEGRSIRKWVPDEGGRHWNIAAQAAFTRNMEFEDDTKLTEHDFFEKKLLSPAKMEKLIGKKLVKKSLTEYIVTPRGGPKLVLQSDPRPPLDRNEFTQEDVDALAVEE